MSQPMYCLVVASGREMAISSDLRQLLGPDSTALPMQSVIRKRRNHRGGVVVAEPAYETPLLPGYLFCREAYPRHRHVFGVLSVQDAEGRSKPYPIPAWEIARLLTAAMTPRYEGETARRYAIGDVISTRGTAFDGHKLVVSTLTDDGAVLETTLIGKPVRVRVKDEMIAAA